MINDKYFKLLMVESFYSYLPIFQIRPEEMSLLLSFKSLFLPTNSLHVIRFYKNS